MVINIDSINQNLEPVRDFFTPTLGQTIFNLTLGTPADPTDTVMRVNGETYAEGNPTPGFFSVSGTTVTWHNRFQLDGSDEVEILYFVDPGP